MKNAVPQYYAIDWKLCRINPGSKGPRDFEWNLPGHEIRVLEGFPPGYGVGLLHAFSGTMALDIDNYPVARDWLADRGVDLDALMEADDAVQIVSGRVDSAKLLYRCAPRQGASCAPYDSEDKNGKPVKKMALDFRCATSAGNSQQDALPPTIHPGRGQPYVWRLGLCSTVADLPQMTEALVAVWDEISAPRDNAVVEKVVPCASTHSDIERWLRTQDAGACRNDWVKIGAKLHAQFQGGPDGFALWQNWSASSPKWDDEARAQAYPVWKSFKLEGRALATLEADVRQMPADPGEFPVVEEALLAEPANLDPATPAAVGDLVETESPTQRAIRELLQPYVIVQTGGAKRYFLLPGHPEPSIASAAGNSGLEMTSEQVDTVFGPYMPAIVENNRVIIPNASEIMKRASWRKPVHRVGFRPSKSDDRFYVEGDGHTYLNGYRAIPVEPVKPREHEIEPLLWLFRRVLDDQDKPTGGVFAIWLRRLYAYALQNPGRKVKWAPLLYSETQGTGKTTLMQTLPSLLFGKQHVNEIVHSTLRERFAGAQFDTTWWAFIAEMHGDKGKSDAREIANKLKPWITDERIQIEKKGENQYSITNYLQFTAQSQHPDALFMEDGANDRRWLIGQMTEKRLTLENQAMLNPIFGASDKRDARAVNWLHWYFLHVDLSGFDPDESPPVTIAKTRVAAESQSVWEDEIQDAMFHGAAPFNKDLVTPSELTKGLLIKYGLSFAQARSQLRKIGAVEIMRRFNFTKHVYSVRHHEQWAQASQRDIQSHLLSAGPRPFDIVDDGSDLI